MKKIFSLILAVALSCMIMVPVLAADNADHTIEVNGYIGLDTDIDNYVTVGITYPAKVNWYATNATRNGGGTFDVDSPAFQLSNRQSSGTSPDATKVDLAITLVSFTETTATGLTTTDLELNLTGDLSETPIGDDLQAGYTGTTAYSALLMADTDWTFGFDGEYKHTTLPASAIEPQYDMVLNFKIDTIHQF